MTLSRRKFLAATAAAPLVFSRASGIAANEKLALGFIGVGTMGRGHLGGFLGRKEIEVVAVCDVAKVRLDSAKETVEKKYADRIKSGDYKGVQAVADFRELLAHKGLDAVVIATPDHWHTQVAILAARAGKHIYCEKPLTHNVAEGRMIVDEVKKAKITFQTGSQRAASSTITSARPSSTSGTAHRQAQDHRIGVGGRRSLRSEDREIPPGTDWDFWQGPALNADTAPCCARRSSTSTSPTGGSTRSTRAGRSPTWARTTSTSRSGR